MAQPQGATPLPPFQKWSFREIRYIQWLADQHAVHYALEAAVADATTVAATEHYGEISHLSIMMYICCLWLTDGIYLGYVSALLLHANVQHCNHTGSLGAQPGRNFGSLRVDLLYLHAHAAPKLCWSDDLGQGKGICDCR